MTEPKYKTYEFFTPDYSIIIQAENILDATLKFTGRYQDRVIQVMETDFFALKNREKLAAKHKLK